MKPREPWIEVTLRGWAQWVTNCAPFEGAGSGIDRQGVIAEAGWGRKANPGVYSDPTLAEVMASLRDKQGPFSAMHAEITGLPRDERRVLVARYCGMPVRREFAAHVGERPVEFQWSGGPLPFDTIAVLLRIKKGRCRDLLERAQLRLMFRMEVRRMIRKGEFAPDGGMIRTVLPDAA